ncbi:MAG: diadenylate cyclase CdaA [Leptospiraceae bacterium]|nr:diadenylate cyclase CdaA [Leptospiraceae bacterium]MDW8306804.1 diadenylate cyclase CdaA [Leptospiraceae bacterium]
MLSDITELLTSIRAWLDILLVAFLLYQIYRLVASSRAIPILVGLLLFLLLSPISRFLQLETLSFIFDIFSNFLIIAVIVTLQPELRRMFYRMGQASWIRQFMTLYQIPVDEILSSLQHFSETKTGALLVLVNKTGLQHLAESGIVLQAKLSRELLMSVFYEQNPLHDGAVIIEGHTITSAGVYLPLSTSAKLKKTHGARHRAAVGITEESDALAIVVSETTGKVSCAFMGELAEAVDINVLKSLLSAFNADRLAEEWESQMQLLRHLRGA